MRERKHFRMRSEPCAFLSRYYHVFLIFFRTLLGYLKDCNVAAHSVDSDIFYIVINLSVGSKSYIITLASNCGVWIKICPCMHQFHAS